MLRILFIECSIILWLFAVLAPKLFKLGILLLILVLIYQLCASKKRRKGDTIRACLTRSSGLQKDIDVLEFSNSNIPVLKWYEGIMIGWPQTDPDQWKLSTSLCLNGSYLVANKFDEKSMVSRKLKSLATGQEMCMKVVPLFNESDILNGILIIVAIDIEIFNFLKLILISCESKSINQVRLVLGCARPSEALFKPVLDDLSHNCPKFTTVYVYNNIEGAGNSNAGQMYRFGDLQAQGLQKQDLLGLALDGDNKITVITSKESAITSEMREDIKGAHFLYLGSP